MESGSRERGILSSKGGVDPLKRERLFAKLVLILCKGRYYLLKIMQKAETNSLQKEKSKQHIGAF